MTIFPTMTIDQGAHSNQVTDSKISKSKLYTSSYEAQNNMKSVSQLKKGMLKDSHQEISVNTNLDDNFCESHRDMNNEEHQLNHSVAEGKFGKNNHHLNDDLIDSKLMSTSIRNEVSSIALDSENMNRYIDNETLKKGKNMDNDLTKIDNVVSHSTSTSYTDMKKCAETLGVECDSTSSITTYKQESNTLQLEMSIEDSISEYTFEESISQNTNEISQLRHRKRDTLPTMDLKKSEKVEKAVDTSSEIPLSTSPRVAVKQYFTRIKKFIKGREIGYLNFASEGEPDQIHSGSTTPRSKEKLRNLDRLTRIMCDESNMSVIKGVLVFEKPIPTEKIERLFEERIVQKFLRFRSRLVRGTFIELMPEEIDIKKHIRNIYLDDEENTEEHLRSQLSQHVNKPFDPMHSPWEAYIVHNFEGGFVMMLRVHHAIGDGSAMSMIFNELCDQDIQFPNCKPPEMTFFQKMIAIIVIILLQLVNLVRVIWKSLYMIFGSSDPESPIKVPISEMAREKKVCWTRPFNLEKTKQIGKPYKATLNDVMLTVIAGGLDRFSIAKTKSDPMERDIRCIHPINTRTSPIIKTPNNEAAFLFALLPLGIQDPEQRLLEIKRRMDHLKSINEKTYAKFLIGLLNLIPGRMLKPAMDWMTSKVTVAVSNVRGPDFPLTIEGVEIKDCIGLLPSMHGIGVSCCIFSYNGSLRLGLTTDATLTDRPQEELIHAMEQEYDHMLSILNAKV